MKIPSGKQIRKRIFGTWLIVVGVVLILGVAATAIEMKGTYTSRMKTVLVLVGFGACMAIKKGRGVLSDIPRQNDSKQ